MCSSPFAESRATENKSTQRRSPRGCSATCSIHPVGRNRRRIRPGTTRKMEARSGHGCPRERGVSPWSRPRAHNANCENQAMSVMVSTVEQQTPRPHTLRLRTQQGTSVKRPRLEHGRSAAELRSSSHVRQRPTAGHLAGSPRLGVERLFDKFRACFERRPARKQAGKQGEALRRL